MTTDTLLILTPGPLTTARPVREAMLRDWGSRDPAFIALTAELRARLLAVGHGEASHVAIPLQGSGTYALEAAVATLVGPADRLLVLTNGRYGERLATIARRMGRSIETLAWADDAPVVPSHVADALAADPAISHVAIVHCETTSGILNPLDEIAAIVSAAGRVLLVDAMSSFGALPIDLRSLPADIVVSSVNKCLEGVPGIAFALVRARLIERCAGQSPSLSLDLYDQWRGFEKTGQWRFTPPVQVVAAAVEALRRLEAEGGPAARYRRYAANLEVLVDGAAANGLNLYLDPRHQAPIIATFLMPLSPFDFETFYRSLEEGGFLIYPGKLTTTPSFRIGCIGAVVPDDFRRLVDVLPAALAEAGRAPQRPLKR